MDELLESMSLFYQAAMIEGESAVSSQWRQELASIKVPSEVVAEEFARRYLTALIQAATIPPTGKKTKSTRAARELCHFAAYCLERQVQMPAELRDLLIRVLNAGAQTGSVDAAIGLKRGQGQAKSEDPLYVLAKQQRIAARIFGLIYREGLSEPQAKERVCEEFELDTRRVEQIWKEHRPPPDAFANWEAWLEKLFALKSQIPHPFTGAAYEAWWRSIGEHLRIVGIDVPRETK